VSESRVRGFYKLSVSERIDTLAKGGWLTAVDAENLRQGRFTLLPTVADRMVENVVGIFGLPFAVAPNFIVNGRDYLVPMVVEEPSIVAGTSKSALLARKAGGLPGARQRHRERRRGDPEHRSSKGRTDRTMQRRASTPRRTRRWCHGY
jgi:hydroxymethylglutaryl-CoA reductase